MQSLWEMHEFEKEGITKSRPVVKKKLNKWYDWLVDYVPKPIKNAVSNTFSRLKNCILRLYVDAKKTLKGDMRDAAEKDNQEEDIDLTLHEIERAFKGAFENCVIPGTLKTDIVSYFDRTKPHIKALIGKQPEEMESAKVIMTLWARKKKAIESVIKLDPKDAETSSNIYTKRISAIQHKQGTQLFYGDCNDTK